MDKEKLTALMKGIAAAVKSHVQDAIKANNETQQARLNKSTAALESAERRLSRHADHLARLESRLKTRENK